MLTIFYLKIEIGDLKNQNFYKKSTFVTKNHDKYDKSNQINPSILI